MATFWISALLVATAEMGDRTQLLTIMLAARYRQPAAIIAGVFVATIANHLLAALAGYYVASLLNALWFRYLIGASFIVMAIWALVPDKESDAEQTRTGLGVFATTVVSFFIVEIGDKTQIATAALAATYHSVFVVAAGTTVGMLAANIPAAFFGHTITRVIPMDFMRAASAGIYLVLGIASITHTAGFIR